MIQKPLAPVPPITLRIILRVPTPVLPGVLSCDPLCYQKSGALQNENALLRRTTVATGRAKSVAQGEKSTDAPATETFGRAAAQERGNVGNGTAVHNGQNVVRVHVRQAAL